MNISHSFSELKRTSNSMVFKAITKLNFVNVSSKTNPTFFHRKMSLQCHWEKVVKMTEIHVMTTKGCEPRSKIAAFDMDGTIICTKSGRVFALNIDDWQLLYQPQVKQKLQRSYFQISHEKFSAVGEELYHTI